VLSSLAELVKQGVIAELRVVNIEQQPESARALGVRSVPWVRIGPFELAGLRSRSELQQWAEKAHTTEGMAAYFEELLNEGGVAQVLQMIEAAPQTLAALLSIIANPEAKLNARLGAGAVIEDHEGSAALKAVVPQLIELTHHDDHRVRSDACHYLSLTHDNEVRPVLEARLQDEHADVREVAQESLDALDLAEP
jgi:hypothetical protein